MTPLRQHIGAELRRLRAASGLGQTQAADAVGCSQSSIVRAERGDLSLDLLARLLDLYRAELRVEELHDG